jgi:hypothetical protein
LDSKSDNPIRRYHIFSGSTVKSPFPGKIEKFKNLKYQRIAIAQHIYEYDHEFDFKNTRILNQERNTAVFLKTPDKFFLLMCKNLLTLI